MGRALWLADACRAADLPVTEIGGWRERGSASFDPQVVICHHTAGPAKGDYPSLGIVRDGRAGLPGPLAQFGLGRSGTVYVIASGRANHAGMGNWRGVAGNTKALGIEAESVGTRDDWTPEQRQNYPILAAALLRHMGRGAEWVCGHKEWAPTRKIDPAFWDMGDFRSQVGRLLDAGPNEEEDMLTVPIDLAPGEEVLLSVEPAGNGFFGRTESLLVLDSIDGSVAQVFGQFAGGGEVAIQGGRRFTREFNGGWLHVHNRGRARIGGALLTKRV